MLELGFSKLIQPIVSTTTSVPNLGMDPAHGSEVLKHLNKQNQALSEAHATMFRELEVLQVEEEMLMRKLYEIMSKNGLFNKAVIIVAPIHISLFLHLHALFGCKESGCV